MRRAVAAAVIVLCCVLPARAPAPESIDVLCMGGTAPWMNPLVSWGRAEPSLVLTLIPCGWGMGLSGMAQPDADAGRKLIRIYFPRGYRELTQNDFLVFEHMFMDFLTHRQIDDMSRSIVSEGLGGFVAIGGVTNQGLLPNLGWINSRLSEIFPSEASEGIFEMWASYGIGGGRIKINMDPVLPPVLKMMVPLGMDGIWQPYSWLMVPKEGSKIWARSIDGKENPPFLISWQYGEGETWSNNLGMTYEWWFLTDPRMGGNPFALDVFMNMLYYSARMDLPDDILVIHAARKALEDYEDTKSSLLALVEFADRFGANTNLIYDELNDADEIRERGRALYLEQRYEESLTILGDARELLAAAAGHAIQLKNRALIWTYAIEWLVVLGTLILSGEALYSFMVKRKLHHEVPRTRLARL